MHRGSSRARQTQARCLDSTARHGVDASLNTACRLLAAAACLPLAPSELAPAQHEAATGRGYQSEAEAQEPDGLTEAEAQGCSC